MVAIKQSLAVLLGAFSLVSSVVIPRQSTVDVTTIINDFNAISNNITAFNSSVSAFSGDFLSALVVNQDATNLDNSVKATNADLALAAQLSVTDSTTVTNAVSALGVTVVNSLQALTAKESVFQSGGFNSIVLSQLGTLHTDTEALSSALLKIVQPTDAPTVQNTSNTLEAAYNATIAAFTVTTSK